MGDFYIQYSKMSQTLTYLPNQQANSKILQSRWQDLNNYFTQESIERSTDIDDLLQNLSKKMDHNSSKDHKNFTIISNQLEQDSNHVIAVRQLLLTAQAQQKEYILDQTEQNDSFVKQELAQRQQMIKDKSYGSSQAVREILKDFTDLNEKVVSEAEQGMEGFDSFRKGITTLLTEGRKDHHEILEAMHGHANQECEEMLEMMREFQEGRKEEEIKIKYMIEELNSELNDVVEREEKAGCIVYDCLLSTIQDCYSKMHSNLARK